MKQQELFNEIKQALQFGAIYRTDECIKLSYNGKRYIMLPGKSCTTVTINNFCEQNIDSKREPVIDTVQYTGLQNKLLGLYARMYVGRRK
jgi:hypothetical protein